MAKKHNKKWYRPQKRERLRETVGKLEFVDVVYMAKERDEDGVEQVYATCTCDQWRSSPEATTIQKVALEAKAHVQAGPCVFRPHSPDQNPYINGISDEERNANQRADSPESGAGLQGGDGPSEELGDEEGRLRQGGSEGSSTSDAGGDSLVGGSESSSGLEDRNDPQFYQNMVDDRVENID